MPPLHNKYRVTWWSMMGEADIEARESDILRTESTVAHFIPANSSVVVGRAELNDM